MKTTVFVHILNGVVSQVEAVGDGEIDVIVLNQDLDGEERLTDEGGYFDYPRLSGEYQKSAALAEIEKKVKSILDEDSKKFDEI